MVQVQCRNCKREVDQRLCYVCYDTKNAGYSKEKIISYECAKDTKKCTEISDDIKEIQRKTAILENIDKLTTEKERRKKVPFVKKERPSMLTRMASFSSGYAAYDYYSNEELDKKNRKMSKKFTIT